MHCKHISLKSPTSENLNSIISITIAAYQCALIQGNSHDHVSISHCMQIFVAFLSL